MCYYSSIAAVLPLYCFLFNDKWDNNKNKLKTASLGSFKRKNPRLATPFKPA